jgi:hypothetical protein
MLGKLFGRQRPLDDDGKLAIAKAVAEMLGFQLRMAADKPIVDEHGRPRRKALGYVYGYTDAVLRTRGHDMADVAIGVPVTFQVIRRLWPNHVNECMDYLAKNIASDPLMMAGAMHGGQQYLDYRKTDVKGVPMGLARFLIEGDNV